MTNKMLKKHLDGLHIKAYIGFVTEYEQLSDKRQHNIVNIGMCICVECVSICTCVCVCVCVCVCIHLKFLQCLS